jgi:hypothetical protein
VCYGRPLSRAMTDRILFLADQFVDAMRVSKLHYPGGAEQTDEGILAASPLPVERASVSNADPAAIANFDLIVCGNLQRAQPALLAALVAHGRHVLFEHDYRMCRYRGHYARGMLHRLLDRCVCRQARFGPLFASALGVIFLTTRQLREYEKNPYLLLGAHAVLGCSVMGESFFARVERHAKERPEKKGTVVVHSEDPIKGFRDSVAWCRARGIEPEVLRGLGPDALLDALSRAERLVFLPRWVEPASRLVVEARLLGCEVVGNERVGVMGEPFWGGSDAAAVEHLRDASARFWRLVAGFRSGQPAR